MKRLLAIIGILALIAGLAVTAQADIYDQNRPVTVTEITDTGLTASKPVFTDANKKLTSTGTTPIAQGGTGQTDAAAAFGALKQAATESATGVAELATTGEAQTGTDTTRIVTPAGLNSVVFQNAKTQLINAVYSIVTPANVKGFWIFDQTGAVSTITDRSTIGGATAHTVTLRDNAYNAINASTCSPGVSGLAPYLTFDTTHIWDTPDSVDFSPTSGGGTDTAVSMIVLGNMTAMNQAIMMGKRYDVGNWEWFLWFDGSAYFNFYLSNIDVSGYIGRRCGSLSAQIGSWNTYGVTYDASKASSGIKLYNNAARVDTTDTNSGVYAGITDGAAKMGSYSITVADPANQMTGKMSVALYIVEELTAVQMARLDAVLRGYAGVVY